MRQIQPDNPSHLRDLGVIYYQAGAMHQAATFLEAYVQQEPEARDVPTIRQGIAQALDDWVRQN